MTPEQRKKLAGELHELLVRARKRGTCVQLSQYQAELVFQVISTERGNEHGGNDEGHAGD